MRENFLLEILVQELPYKFIPSAISQLKSSFDKLFKENGVDFDEIKVYATPRRLCVLVENLAKSQETVIKDLKGPILNIAKDANGEYTPAAIGFAKKNNVELKDLYEKDNYIFAHVEIKGRTTTDILKENVESLILKLQGSHFMRWAYNTEKFSRPIENVVALFGSEIVDLKILDKTATNITQGHRYSKNRIVKIDKIENYFELLKQANVIVNQEERRQLIIDLATKCAKENNLVINFDNTEELLEEITYITEWPIPVLCDFDEKYLEIPNIVTTTVMINHQRYFPLWQENGKLSNHFITMANFVGSEFENIKAGNQRVVCARLEDGIFFFKEDTKTKLEDKLESLKGMTFQKDLGTLFDKTQRMIKISEYLADKLNAQNKEDILRIAKLAKCDLSTKLVFEFTELQGFIGQNYALVDNEKENIAKGISEHYFPLGAYSELPSNIESQIVSIADKIDTICALFISTQNDKKKKRPTGSNDPLGARRAAIGVLRIIIENKLNIDLEDMFKYCLELLSKEFNIELEATILDELKEFFVARLLFMYEKEFSSNTINSLVNSNPCQNVVDFVKKAEILTKCQKDTNFDKLKENATRISRILKDNKANKVDESLFVIEEEKTLYKAILAHNESKEDFEKYINSLNVLIEPIVQFFDKVLVMDKDENIKNNRLALLENLREKFAPICDFEKL